MSTVPKRLFTPEEYALRERESAFKSEYFQGEIFAMAGTTWEHTLIKDNLAFGARKRLTGTPCVVVTSDLRVKIDATGLYTYPDVLIVCDVPEFENLKGDDPNRTLLNPRIIVEVLSKSTESYDRGDKFDHYRQVPSILEYILVSQERPMIERYVREEDGWKLTEFKGLAETFAFAHVPVSVPMAEIYERVTFPVANEEAHSRPWAFRADPS